MRKNERTLWKIHQRMTRATYFMKARLVLLSKEETNMPEIENTRPISIVPAVTKLFKISILHNLEKATKLDQFNKLQRGFMKN